MKLNSSFSGLFEAFAEEVRAKFKLPIAFQPEDQLKNPVSTLIEKFGAALKLKVETVSEVHADKIGRPDLGIAVKGLLTGHIELKAPGKGANPERFKRDDKKQWDKFKDLPNLIYTDGTEWALYRTGKRQGERIRFSGDISTDGKSAITSAHVDAIIKLLQDFLRWEPIVPNTPTALANLIAPLCRYLRNDVLNALQKADSNLSLLAADWRKYLFPDADDSQFADAYAQTLTYALLLARFSSKGDELSIPKAVTTIRGGHRLLADTLNILGDPKAREEIATPVDLLERVISAVEPIGLTKKTKRDLWLYFYEDFLAVYDPKMRTDRGVYYTPVEVVQTQIRLIAQLLEEHFNFEYSFVDKNVITLDPGAGTGTYILAALQHGLNQVERVKGAGMRASAASEAAKNMYALEILVGPYAVAHLRLTQEIISEGGQLPPTGVHVYLTDTLESPNQPPPSFPFAYKELAEEHKRAQQVKARVPVLVCIGNPPYDRQQIEEAEKEIVKRKGGWVRFGDKGEVPIFEDFLKPLEPLGLGVHAKNLYNDYVYFWRWALWKVFENKGGPGIVSFITASSYLRGPGFAGMRQMMRQVFDEMWIIDLEGDKLGARKTENVFAIQTPVAIAIGVRYAKGNPEKPASVHYTRIDGTSEEKLKTLDKVHGFKDLGWKKCLSEWTEPLLPTSDKPYWSWPLLTDVFPWQASGLQFKRSWPIGESIKVLEKRWEVFLEATDGKQLFKETRDRKIDGIYPDLMNTDKKLSSLWQIPKGSPVPNLSPVAYRSFDIHWIILDNRLGDYLRPSLQITHSGHQIYLTSLLTKVLGKGPSATACSLLPDMDHFCNRGAKDIIPLWRNREATEANITGGILKILKDAYSQTVSPEDLFAYCYAVLASPDYVLVFWDELTIPGPRIPITKDRDLFNKMAELGKRLLWLHTYGERFIPPGNKFGKIPLGQAKCKIATPGNPKEYPEEFSYALSNKELHVGKGVFGPVSQEVWEFSVSGFEVVKSWLAYRMKKGAGKKSSPLDNIRPEKWEFDDELLQLLWILEHTLNTWPSLSKLLNTIMAGSLFDASDFPSPSDIERQGPKGEKPLLNDLESQ